MTIKNNYLSECGADVTYHLILLTILIIAIIFTACSDNATDPPEIPTGSAEISYTTEGEDETISGEFSLSGVDICESADAINPGDTPDFFENQENSCVAAGINKNNQMVITAIEPAGGNEFNLLGISLPPISDSGTVDFESCSTGNCTVLYATSAHFVSKDTLDADRILGLPGGTVEITDINDDRITGTFTVSGGLTFSEDNRPPVAATATGSFDIPILGTAQ